METAHSIKNNIDEFLKNELFPRLEMLFDTYDLTDTVIRLDEVNVNLSVNNSGDLNQLKYEIVKQFEDKIKPKLEPVLQIQSGFPKTQVENFYGSEPNKPGSQKILKSKNQWNTFLFFLANGYLPWYGKEEQIKEVISFRNWVQNVDNPAFIEEMRNVFLKEDKAIERFVNQLEVENCLVYLSKINPEIRLFKNQILIWISKNEITVNQFFLKLMMLISLDIEIENITKQTRIIFYEISKNSNKIAEKDLIVTIQELIHLLRGILSERVKKNSHFIERLNIFSVENPTKKEIKRAFLLSSQTSNSSSLLSGNTALSNSSSTADSSSVVVSSSSFKSVSSAVPEKFPDEIFSNNITSVQDNTESFFFEKETHEIAVRNAGIIIVHPFLKHFFINTGIADKAGNPIKTKLDLAVQTVHFMATGFENVFEGNLVFEKFICGVPLKRPVKKQSLLTDEIREEVEVMLKEVIRNWPALKNSSVNDLRQMFFQRDGKLIPLENKYKLLVERKAQDILLEKLSWNISMIKLPWIKELITVEW